MEGKYVGLALGMRRAVILTPALDRLLYDNV